MDEYVVKTLDLLRIEHEAEVLEVKDKVLSESPARCEQLGLSILNLDIHSISLKLFGRTAIFLKYYSSKPLPSTFKVGDEVELQYSRATGEPQFINGVVTGAREDLIDVVIDSLEEAEAIIPPVRLNRRASDVTYKKLCATLSRLLHNEEHPLVNQIYKSTIVLKDPDSIPLTLEKGEVLTLNPSQINAVEKALSTSLVSLIHGPPGTGKTATLAELIVQAVRKKQRILVCAPSNAAVDNLLDRVLSHENSSDIQCVRLGHPSRIEKKLIDHCLDSMLAQSDGREVIEGIKDDIEALRKQKHTNTKSNASCKDVSCDADRKLSRKERYQQLKDLQKDLKKYEKKVVEDLLQSCNVIFSTCVGASSSLLKDKQFDLVVIDEAGQGLEVEALIPLLHGKRVVLAGDPNQLPPTIKSSEAATKGLGISLLEKLMRNTRFQNVTFLLDTQYRMHSDICYWASEAMYEARLKSHSSAADRSLNLWMPGLSEPDESYSVMTLIDTTGCEFTEQSTITGSRYNETEAEVVCRYASILIFAGANPQDIGIITPYNGQVSYLKALFTTNACLFPKYPAGLDSVAIRTVDGFQGGEKEIIILSMVRSNDKGEVGFLSDRRRINVAVTRARRHLTVIGDMATCEENEFMAGLLAYISNRGDHRSAMELIADDWAKMSLSFVPFINTVTNESFPDKESLRPSQGLRNKAANPEKSVKKSKSSFPRNIGEAVISDDKFRESLTEVVRAFAAYAPISVRGLTNISAKLSGQNVLMFESSISSFHRRLVHEACDGYGNLSHISLGEGSDRHLQIVRQPEPEEKKELPISQPEKSLNVSTAPATPPSPPLPKLSNTVKKADKKLPKGVHTIGSSGESISDDQFHESVLDLFSSFSNNLPIETDILNKLSAMKGGEHVLLFSSKLPPHRRNLLKNQHSKFKGLSFNVVGNPPQVEIIRNLSVVEPSIDVGKFEHLDVDDSTLHSENSIEVRQLSEIPKDTVKIEKSSLKASKSKSALDIDEDEALRLAMEEVKAYEKAHQYRIKSTPFPNNEKVVQKSNLHAKLKEAADSRKPKAVVKETKNKK